MSQLPDHCTERPEHLEQITAQGTRQLACALVICLRSCGIPCQFGTSPQTGEWWCVWVAPRSVKRAELVLAGFNARDCVR